MALPLYLAMTAAEFAVCSSFPAKCAWMACHFSPYGTGLSNCPKKLPPGSLLILNDRTPPHGHDPKLICRQLEELCQQLSCSGVLLDFQRPDCPELEKIVQTITAAFPYPVAVADTYATDNRCPVFVAPLPLDQPLQAYLAPWEGREIWMDLAVSSGVWTVDKKGSLFTPCPPESPGSDWFYEKTLYCHYHAQRQTEQLLFTLTRTQKDLESLLEQAKNLGVTQAVGLYQEMNPAK